MIPHTSRTRAALAVVAIVALAMPLAACGDDDKDTTTAGQDQPAEATIVAEGAWARTSPAVASAGAVYMTISNPTDIDDALVGVIVDPSIAAKAEIHETVAAGPGPGSTVMGEGMPDGTMPQGTMPQGGMPEGGGMMRMQAVPRLDVPAGAVVTLEPGGYHLMLIDLAAPLTPGSTVELTLDFEVAGDVVVRAEVRDTAP